MLHGCGPSGTTGKAQRDAPGCTGSAASDGLLSFFHLGVLAAERSSDAALDADRIELLAELRRLVWRALLSRMALSREAFTSSLSLSEGLLASRSASTRRRGDVLLELRRVECSLDIPACWPCPRRETCSAAAYSDTYSHVGLPPTLTSPVEILLLATLMDLVRWPRVDWASASSSLP